MRICSLLPSATEIVYSLGLGESLVAVTHECDYPPEARALPRITRAALHMEMPSREIDAAVTAAVATGSSLYELDLELLKRLRPDVILTQELCHVCAVSVGEVRRALRALPSTPRVVNLEPHSLAEILENIREVAAITGKETTGAAVVRALEARIEKVRVRARDLVRPSVFCMEWADPPFCGGHWMKELVEIAGGRDDLAQLHRPSRRVSWQEILDFAPEVLVFACCGFDLARSLREVGVVAGWEGFGQLPAVRAGRVHAVDATAYFSRPGPRIVDSLEVLAHLIHPEVFTAPTLSGAFATRARMELRR